MFPLKSEQIVKHVKHAPNPSLRSSTAIPSPVRFAGTAANAAATMAPSGIGLSLSSSRSRSSTNRHRTPSLFVSRQKYGDEVTAEATTRSGVGNVHITHREPTTDPPITSFLPTVPHPPVRVYIFFIAHKRATHPPMFPRSAYR